MLSSLRDVDRDESVWWEGESEGSSTADPLEELATLHKLDFRIDCGELGGVCKIIAPKLY